MTCAYCTDGLLIVSIRDGWADEYGPCPNCEAGARAEARLWPGGYWQGRPATVQPKTTERILSQAENKLRMALLRRRLAGENVDPSVGVDIRDDAVRLRLVEREAVRVAF